MSTSIALRPETSPRTRPTQKTRAGRAAGLLVFALLLGSLSGAVWGVLRPGYEVVVDNGQPVVNAAASPVNVEFASYGWFAVLTGVLGLTLALIAFAQHNGRVAPFELVWVLLTACAGVFAVFTFGVWATGFVSDQPGHDSLVDGAHFHVVPPLRPGVSWLVGPYTAVLAYWLLALVTPTAREEQESY